MKTSGMLNRAFDIFILLSVLSSKKIFIIIVMSFRKDLFLGDFAVFIFSILIQYLYQTLIKMSVVFFGGILYCSIVFGSVRNEMLCFDQHLFKGEN